MPFISQGHLTRIWLKIYSIGHFGFSFVQKHSFKHFLLNLCIMSHNIQLFPEGEVNGGGYIPRHEA